MRYLMKTFLSLSLQVNNSQKIESLSIMPQVFFKAVAWFFLLKEMLSTILLSLVTAVILLRNVISSTSCEYQKISVR